MGQNGRFGLVKSGLEKRVFWRRGPFQKGPFPRDSREFRDSMPSTASLGAVPAATASG